MDDIKLALMTGVDIPIPEFQTTLHQPTIKEISMVGEKNFFVGAQCLCIDKIMLEQLGIDIEEIQTINNFELLMQIFTQEPDKKLTVINLLTLLFPNEKVMMTPKSIILRDQGSENHIIDESNFNNFQELIRKVLCLQLGVGDNFNPANKKAEEIAKKLARARQRVAAQKAAEDGENSLGQYLSVLTVGLGSMSLSECISLTMYQLYDLMERYGLYLAWDLDVKTRLAGGKPDSQPDNWMKPIH